MTPSPRKPTASSGLSKTLLKSRRHENVRYLYHLIWAVIGSILLLIGAGYALGHLSSALAIIAAAALAVFILKAPVDFLERHHVPRWLGTLLAYLVAIALVVAVGFIVMPLLTRQLVGLVSTIPSYATRASHYLSSLYDQYQYLLEDSNINQIVNSASASLSQWAMGFVSATSSGALTVGTGMVTATLVMFISLIVGYWVLKDLPIIKRELLVIAGPRRQEDLSFISGAISRALGGYLRGVVVASICTGTLASIGFTIIGLPYPALFGLMAGIMNFIPYLGPWITGIVVALVGMFISPLTALLAIITVILAQQLTDNLVTPRVMSSTVALHPAIIMVGVFAGGALAGLPGLIAAIPIMASAKSIFVHYFEQRTGRQLTSSDGALFRVPTDKRGGWLAKRRKAANANNEDKDKIPAATPGVTGVPVADADPAPVAAVAGTSAATLTGSASVTDSPAPGTAPAVDAAPEAGSDAPTPSAPATDASATPPDQPDNPKQKEQ